LTNLCVTVCRPATVKGRVALGAVVTNRGLTASELRRAAHVTHEAACDPRGDFVPQALLEALVELVPCFDLSYAECDLRAGRNVGFQDIDVGVTNPTAPIDDSDGHIWQVLVQERSRCYLYETPERPRTDVVRTFDFYTESEWRSSQVYAETYRVGDEWNHLIAPMTPRNGRPRFLIFMRSLDEGPFSDRDRDLLTLLQPHLTTLADRRQREQTVRGLTDRHLEVLRHLAAGLSTVEIAEAMFVSPTTVRKHVENIFERLGVSSRAAAVARALDIAN